MISAVFEPKRRFRFRTLVMRRSRDARLALAAFACLLSTATVAASGQGRKSDLPEPGHVGDKTCSSDPTQSYALYLPSTYTSAKRWPIVYFFDPGGRGRRPLDLYKELAETYGLIFAGSNNSRNFSSEQSKSVNAIWQDTHARLALDERRMYTSGFSGGARVAGAMAVSCANCQIAGVIAHGAGYPDSRGSSKDKLLYFYAVGNQDFNWPEVMRIRRQREEDGLAYRVRVFAGSHQWAPLDVMEDALQWLALRAMQAGDSPRDAAFIDRFFAKMQAEAVDAERRKDAVAELNAYSSLVSDFAGLKDVSEATAKLDALKQSASLKAALKAEQEQIAEQFSLERGISPKLSAYVDGNVPDMNALRIEILQAMGGLKDQAAHAKNEEKRLIYMRALYDMQVVGIENGQQELEGKHFDQAEACFDLMKQLSDDPWPVLMLAETHAATGKKKQAINDLHEAIRRGLKDAEPIESNQRFQALQSEPEFQKLLAELKSH